MKIHFSLSVLHFFFFFVLFYGRGSDSPSRVDRGTFASGERMLRVVIGGHVSVRK